MSMVKYSKIVRRWWWVVALLFVATVGTMLAIALLMKPEYEATVTMQVSAPAPQEVPLYSQFNRSALSDEIAQTRSSFAEFILESDVPYRTVDALPDVKMGGGELRDRTTVDAPPDSQLMRVKVRASDSETAARLANTLVDTGLEQYGQLLAKSTTNTRRFIERELEAAREELRAAESDLTQFQIENKIGSMNSAINSQYELLRSIRIQQDLAQADGDLDRARGLERSVADREAELQKLISLSAQFNDLSDRVERARATHNYLLDRLAEAGIKENQLLELASIQVITPARPPQSPIAALDGKLIVLGGVVSALTGVLLTFLLEYLRVSGTFSSVLRQPHWPESIPAAEKAR